jgi:hypothetical protein
VNAAVAALVARKLIETRKALIEIVSSNSIVERFWMSAKHGWLYLNELPNNTVLESLVGFDVQQHNSVMPHSAFHGQTLDEIYFGTGDDVPARLRSSCPGGPSANRREPEAPLRGMRPSDRSHIQPLGFRPDALASS